MDTGAYMENQMSDQIENSLHKYDEFCQELEKDIVEFISKSRYNWTFEEIIAEYKKHKSGCYVSFSSRQIIKEFEERLKLLL